MLHAMFSWPWLQDGDKFLNDTMERIALNTNAVAASESADLVVEAIVENLAIKQKLFKDLDAGSPRFVFSSMLGFTTKIVSEFIMGVTRKFSSGARFLVKSFFAFAHNGEDRQVLQIFGSRRN